MTMRQGDRHGPEIGRWRLPLILVIASLFVLIAFEIGYAIHDRRTLADQRRSQEPVVEEAIKLRQQLETLAGKTAQLAADGDEGAKNVVDQMKREGIALGSPKQ